MFPIRHGRCRISSTVCGIAFALIVSGHVGWIPESHDYHHAARLARRAAELDDEDPWAHLALGYVAFRERQTDEAVREYMRALDLDPNFATAHGYLGWALGFDGQSEDAIRHLQQALRMSPHDPLKATFYSGTCVAHYYARRYDEGIEWGRKRKSRLPSCGSARPPGGRTGRQRSLGPSRPGLRCV